MYGTPFDSGAVAAAARGNTDVSRLVEDVGPITAARMIANKRNEVRDDEGRQRFHGAFTGGFSAGYYNTVGSKEGWQPKAFVSSRAQPAASGVPARGALHSVRDYMDDEDAQDLLSNVLVAKGGAGDAPGAGTKRSRDWLEPSSHPAGAAGRAQAAGAGAGQATGIAPALAAVFGAAPATTRGAIIPGPLPAELVASSSLSAGTRILRGMGWREGHALGPRHMPVQWGEEGQPQQQQVQHAGRPGAPPGVDEDEAHLSRMWDEGTARPAGFRAGVGYHTQSLRSRDTVGAALASKAQQAAASGTRRLHMSAVLERGAGVGASGSLSLVDHDPYRVSGGYRGLLAGDDEGEDDAGAYRTQGLQDFDIASSRARTGADAKRVQGVQGGSSGRPAFLALEGDHGSAGGGHGKSNARLAIGNGEGQQRLVIEDGHVGRLCFDGRPPLPGFRLAERLERGFLDFSLTHKPPAPPPGWVPRAPTAALVQPLPLYTAHGFVPPAVPAAPALAGSGAGPAHAGPSSYPTPSLGAALWSHGGAALWSHGGAALWSHGGAALWSHGGSQPGAGAGAGGMHQGATAHGGAHTVTRGADPLLASRFVKEGEGQGSVQPGLGAAATAATTAPGPLSAPLPTVGTALRRTTTAWPPSRLLLKRLGLPDPLTKADRDKLEAEANGQGKSGEQEQEWRAVVGAGPGHGQDTGRHMSTGQGSSSGGPAGASVPSQAAPAAAMVLPPRPAAAVFKAIFGADSDDEE